VRDYHAIWKQTYQRLKDDDFKGWDPYDGLTTNISFIHKYYYTRLLFFYFNKFSPLNFRPLFGMKKRVFTQPYTLLGMAHLNRNEMPEAEYFLDIILADSKKEETGYHCWDGLDMPIQMIKSYKHEGSPNVISTELAARFILHFLEKSNKRKGELLEVLKSVEAYFREKMLIEFEGHKHFKYYDITPEELFVFNSNANICAFLADLDSYQGTENNKELVIEIIQSIASYQTNEGYWNYNVNLKTGNPKKQVDFHQGFILDDLLRIMEAYNCIEELTASYKKGLSFYRKNQFNEDGSSYYRIPKKWPVNIHNQSQGIITFTKAHEAGYGEKYLEFAEIIMKWTLENMKGKDGHFYYLKYPVITNKIPYMRWSDANMLYALSVFMRSRI